MQTTIALTTRTDVEGALDSFALNPPPGAESLRPGATADLRDSMARFSTGSVHARRREELVGAIERIEVDVVRRVAAELTASLLHGDRVDATHLANRVPTETLCALLGVHTDVTQIVADTIATVEVIGRGKPSSTASDDAVTRLLQRFSSHPAGAVPAVSLLYQNYDATAALIVATIVAQHRGARRRSAVASTTRVASRAVTIGATTIAAGTVVTVDLDNTGLEFGAGAHRCPAQLIAQCIVDGVIEALTAGGYRLLFELTAFDDVGRAVALPMDPRS